MKKVQVLLLATSLLLLSGCATIMRAAGEEEITIESNPPGARFIISNDLGGRVVAHGITPQPAKVALSNWRKEIGSPIINYHTIQQNYSERASSIIFSKPGFTLLVEKEGYAPKVVPLVPSVSNWYTYGNCATGPFCILGCMIVDPLMSGAMWTLPDKVVVDLVPQIPLGQNK